MRVLKNGSWEDGQKVLFGDVVDQKVMVSSNIIRKIRHMVKVMHNSRNDGEVRWNKFCAGYED